VTPGRSGPRRAIVAVLACFIVAGAMTPLWDRVAGPYTGALVGACRQLVAWLEPAPLVRTLERSGTMVRLVGRPPWEEALGAVETSTISFYLPFIVLVLGVARWHLRLISVPEIVLVLGAVFAVHVTCLGLGVQTLEVDAFRAAGYPSLVGPIENAILRTLHHTYCYSGAQLWAGLVVALVLIRGRRLDLPAPRTPRLAPSGVLAAACGVLILPAVLYVGLSPAVRRLDGGDRSARRIAALACLRAGDRESARRLATEGLDAARPDPETMMLLGLITEETAPAEAEGWYTRVVATRPQNLGARLGRARARVRLGDREAAIAEYYAVLAIAPDNADAYRALGDLYRDQGNGPAARAHYEMAVRFRPAMADAIARAEGAGHSAAAPAGFDAR